MQKFEKSYPLPSSCVKMEVFSLKMDYNDLSKNMFFGKVIAHCPNQHSTVISVLSNGISILFVLTSSMERMCFALY